MKSKLFLAMVALLLAVPFVAGSATVCGVDANARDTVRIGNAIVPVVTPGQLIEIPVYIYADEDISGFSIGFKWTGTNIRYASATLDQEIVDFGFSPFISRKDTVNNIIGLGVANLTAGSLPASNTARLIYTVRFMTKNGATADQITIDSVFFPPAGPWLLTPSEGGTGDGICPEYRHSALIDIRLPVQEFDGPVLPKTYSIDQNNPNPFNPTTSINFALPTAAKTRIDVFNILGQKVRTLVDEYLTAGNKRVEWDGTDDRGNAVASGIYLYRMTANDFTETKKMMLMK